MYSSAELSLTFLSKAVLPLFIPLLVLVISFSFPQPAFAQTERLKAEQFAVYLKPEYDDPRTLVIYEGNFINSGANMIKQDIGDGMLQLSWKNWPLNLKANSKISRSELICQRISKFPSAFLSLSGQSPI